MKLNKNLKKKMRIKDKKAVSGVVTVILIVLLVIIIIGIIWSVIIPMLKESSKDIVTDDLTTNLKIEKLSYDNSSKILNVKVKRNAGKGNLVKIAFIVDGKRYDKETDLKELTSAEFSLNVDNPKKVEIAPVFILEGEEKAGSVKDSRIIGLSINKTEEGEEACKYLVSYYKFEDNVLDEKNKNNGVNNGAVFVSGKIGRALSFNGVDNYVDFGSSSSLNLRKNLTIEAWINPSSGMTQPAYYNTISKGGIYVNGYGLEIYGNRARIEFWTRGNGQISAYWDYGNEANIVGKWFHLVGIFNGTHNLIYVNGVKISVGGTAPGDTLNVPLRAGYTGNPRDGDKYFKGLIDEIAVYNKSLSDTEILSHYNEGAGTDLCPQL